jgi:hypothetical protein
MSGSDKEPIMSGTPVPWLCVVFIGTPLVKIAIESSIPTSEIYFYYFSGFDSIKWGAVILLHGMAI